MKKLLAMLLTGALAVSMLSACGSKEEPAPETDNTTAETEQTQTETPVEAGEAPEARTTFTVGFDANFPPYGYVDENGEYVGFDLSLAQEVADRNGWELVKQAIDWDSKDMELNSGTVDCLWNGFTMQGREEDYTWSDPYVDNSQVFVVAADSGITKAEDLAGKVVLVQAASSALDALNSEECADLKASFAELTEVPEYNTAFMTLEAGAADAVAMDIGVAQYQLASREEGAFVILEEPLATEQYGIGFKLGNTELRDQVQATLYEMVSDGTFDKIAEEFGVAENVCLGK